MIGASLMQSIAGAVDTQYNAKVTPDYIELDTTNGAYLAPSITATAYNGVGPFEYSWESPQDVTLLVTNGNICEVSMSGFNELASVAVGCTIKDLGNGNLEDQDICQLKITFS